MGYAEKKDYPFLSSSSPRNNCLQKEKYLP